MLRFCIIGSGLTGAVTASLISQKMPHAQIVIMEKARGSGGRFCTSRSQFGSSVDLGAQFITKSTYLSEIQTKCYSELFETGLLQPLNKVVKGLRQSEKEENFICVQGSGSIVKHFLKKSGCEVLFGQKVTKLCEENGKWKLSCENTSDFEFDIVISTIPVPQLLQLNGIMPYIQSQQLENLKSVQYSSRFALGLFYDYKTEYFDNLDCVSNYIYDDKIIRFYSIDHKKRNSSDLPSIAVHTTTEFGKLHVEEESMVVGKQILQNFEKVLPNLPQPSFIKYHKWRYSQVNISYPEKPGCIAISEKPLLIGGGDGFSNSTFEGCIFSSEHILKCVLEHCL